MFGEHLLDIGRCVRKSIMLTRAPTKEIIGREACWCRLASLSTVEEKQYDRVLFHLVIEQ